MVMMRADGWTVEVVLTRPTLGGPTEQLVQVKHLGYVIYRGSDLARAQVEAEAAGAPWADLELVDDSGAAAAG